MYKLQRDRKKKNKSFYNLLQIHAYLSFVYLSVMIEIKKKDTKKENKKQRKRKNKDKKETELRIY
jgi:hypothetical protein